MNYDLNIMIFLIQVIKPNLLNLHLLRSLSEFKENTLFFIIVRFQCWEVNSHHPEPQVNSK